MKNKSGQALIGAILLLVILAVIVPVMVTFVQNEARWSVRQGQNTNAFQLAEAALARGYQKVSESTATWKNLQSGQAIPNFNFDNAFTDLSGGSYAISITSGPGVQTTTIIGIGRDKYKNEIRALQAVYTNNPVSGNAIQAGGQVNLGAVNQVEWASIASANPITTSGANHPQMYSAGNITPQDANGSAPPNTDNVQWWSYYGNIPPAPYVDFDFYKSSAQATGTYICENAGVCPGNNLCGATGWSGGGQHTCQNGTQLACKGYTWYFDCPTQGINITSNNNTYFIGTMIVIGNLDAQASAADGAYQATVPQTAWKQYGNDWAYYLSTYGNNTNCLNRDTPPATFPGLTSSYKSPINLTCPLTSVLNHGFTYISGNATFESGGNVALHGAAYIGGTVTLNSGGYVVYYDPIVTQNVATTRILLTRMSWQDVVRGWPTGAGP